MLKRILTLSALCFSVPLILPVQSPSDASTAPGVNSAHGQKLRIPGVPNSGKITEVLYRGAQPRHQGLSELKKLGIMTIVDLRAEAPATVARERQLAESLGMHFVHIPVNGWAPPNNEQVVQFLSLFRDNPGQKIFVHCHFGDDRTGVFVATYRMVYEKWSAEQAMREMYFFGFNGFWHPAMKAFVRDFPSRLNSAPAFDSFHSPALPSPKPS
jgi:protein tyrosine/serine phosphatase